MLLAVAALKIRDGKVFYCVVENNAPELGDTTRRVFPAFWECAITPPLKVWVLIDPRMCIVHSISALLKILAQKKIIWLQIIFIHRPQQNSLPAEPVFGQVLLEHLQMGKHSL